MLTGTEPTGRRYRFGHVIVDCDNFTVEHHGQVRRLSPRAFDVLICLIEHQDRVVGKQELFEQVWRESFVTDSALTQVIKEVRHAIGDDAHTPRYIGTVHKRGYRFIAPVETAAEPTTVVGEGSALPREPRGLPYPPRRWALALVVGIFLVAGALIVAFNVAGLRDRLLTLAGARHAVLPSTIQSIAVLPLKNLSGDPEQEYFTDGMTDALITELGKISALRVISRTSAMHYKGAKKRLPEIAQELNVDAVVEGTVQRSGDRVRITAQLLHARSDRHLWADSYDRDLRDVLALQGELARAIARHIQVAVRPEEEVRLASARPESGEAYEAYLKGRYYWFNSVDAGGPEAVQKALDYFEQALAIDPTYAPAYAGLADMYSALRHGVGFSYEDTYPKAKAAAENAIRLDDSLSEGHASLGRVKFIFEWDWAGAEREWKRALELNPSNAHAHYSYRRYLAGMGRFDEAVAANRRAIELDPLTPRTSAGLGWVLLQARRYDEAIVRLQKLLELYPTSYRAHYHLAHNYAAKGMYLEAAAQADKAGGRAAFGWVYAVSGRRREAVKILRELTAASKSTYVEPLLVASTYGALGERDKAFKWLEQAYIQRSPWMGYLRVSPTLDPLRSDPRFQDLLHRMNFPP